jgi:malonyl-ACP decarboxylase
VAATLLQMRAARVHPCRNLQNPMDRSFGWVGEHAEDHEMRHALNLSFGFGGVNTALSLAHPDVFKGEI